MILYCTHHTNRIQYMANWLGNYLFGRPLQVTHQVQWRENEFVLNYSDEQLPGTFRIAPHGLLFQTGIQPQPININQPSATPFFFETTGKHPFDLLSAVFYLVSRYEEWLTHEKDFYGRYAHTNSLAFQNHFLQRPLVDEWMQELKVNLQTFYPPIEFAEKRFSFIPTYDIDMAWSYREKGFLRNAAGSIKQISRGQWAGFKNRLLTLARNEKDPFDVFDELDALHSKHDLQPIYFFLLAAKYKGYDKNISPTSSLFKALIKKLAENYKTGLHLSWQAWENSFCMQEEKERLVEITGAKVASNRMHFIKFNLPQTFQQLIELGITNEYSMGYGSINGFRASTCTPYYWFNLEKEEITSLQIFPFAYMEANSIFEQKESPEEALAEMLYYHDTIKKLQGTFISIFHNHLIGRNKEGRQWWNMYAQFLEKNFWQERNV